MSRLSSNLKRCGWILLTLAFIAVAVWVCSTALVELFGESQGGGAIAGQERLTGGSKEAGLAIEGWVDENNVLLQGHLRSWYHLSSLSSGSIKNLQLHLHAPGFELPPPPQGWSNKVFPVHVIERSDAIAPSSALPDIGPGSGQTLWVDLAAHRAGDSMLTAWFTWTGPQGEMHAESLDLGPLHLRSAWLQRVAAWKDFIIALAPVAIPILVLVLGFRFQKRQQDIVQERQAWATMLPAGHDKNMKTYVPLISAIVTFEGWLKTFGQDRTADSLRAAFFYLLLTIRAMRKVDADGGYSLQNREGEELIGKCYNAVQDRLETIFKPYEIFSSVVDTIKLRDSISTYTGRLRDDAAMSSKVTRLEITFKDWITASLDDLIPLSLGRSLLLYELNRFYKFWYGAPEPFPFDEVNDLLSRCTGRAGEKLKASAKEIYEYSRESLTLRQRSKLRATLHLSWQDSLFLCSEKRGRGWS